MSRWRSLVEEIAVGAPRFVVRYNQARGNRVLRRASNELLAALVRTVAPAGPVCQSSVIALGRIVVSGPQSSMLTW